MKYRREYGGRATEMGEGLSERNMRRIEHLVKGDYAESLENEKHPRRNVFLPGVQRNLGQIFLGSKQNLRYIHNRSEYHQRIYCMKNIRHSKQRDRILEVLRNTDVHPTANWLYHELKDEFPDLSMGTVYRNLTILMEQGLVNKIDFGSTFDRFEARIQPHYHFICENCNAVIDLDVPVDNTLNDRIADTTGFTPSRHRIEFFGICDGCRKE
ncbi:MAG: Fur family transcriptional regulator [Candidatus Latescibacterota bacterium]